MPTLRNPIHRWPSWLDVAVVEGYTVVPEDRRQSSDLEIGTQLRVVFDTDETTITCQLVLDSLSANWFEAFERDILVQGSRWFWLPVWVGGQTIDHLVRFKTRPQLGTREPGEEGYSVYSFELNVGKRQGLMEKEWVEFWLENDPYIFVQYEDKLQHVVNVLYPKALPFNTPL